MAPFTGRPAESSFTLQRRHHETVVRIGGGSLQTETKQRENPDH
jgi:hypothetical protein